jgi:hypothetical protein
MKQKHVLKLLVQLRHDLQSNQGMMAKQNDRAIIKLDRIIAIAKTNNISDNYVLILMVKVFKLLPSIVDLIKKYWNA